MPNEYMDIIKSPTSFLIIIFLVIVVFIVLLKLGKRK